MRILKNLISEKTYITFCYFVLLLFVTSCTDSNEIYYDASNSYIKSATNSKIHKLYMYVTMQNECYVVYIKLKYGKNGDTFVNLKSISSDYETTYSDMARKSFYRKKFILQPNSEYELHNHSFGDTPEGILYLHTDSVGNLFAPTDKR